MFFRKENITILAKKKEWFEQGLVQFCRRFVPVLKSFTQRLLIGSDRRRELAGKNILDFRELIL